MEDLAALGGRVTELSYALDTLYFLVMGAFVMWMAAGFTMLEAGLVRAKNTAEILTKNVGLYSIACIMYMLCGYSIMYPGDVDGSVFASVGNLFGGLLGSADNTVDDVLASGGKTYHSELSNFFFQVVFVATAMSIVSGAVAERMKLWSFFLFAVVLTGFIYPVQGFWKWGGGWLDQLGFQDFAGSGIVHLCGAAAAFAGVLMLGARKGKYGPQGQVQAIPGCNLPLATLGTLILWLGWFGFNGGSQLALGSAADAIAISTIYINTNIAAVGGVLAAMALTQLIYKKVDLSMTLNGAIAGLVSITAGPDTPSLGWAFLIGAVGGAIVVFLVPLLDKFKIDDVVGAISAHLGAGIWGTLAVPLRNGDASFVTQAIGVAAIGAFVIVASTVFWLVIKSTIGIRVGEEEEMLGLDQAELGMEAYPEFGRGSQIV